MTARPTAVVGTIVTAVATIYIVALLLGMSDPDWGAWARPVVHLGELAVLLALGGAVGRGAWGRIGIGLAGIGLLMMAVAEPTMNELLFTIAPNLVGLGMIVTGVAVLREGVWTGGRRWLPLVQGIAVFAVLTPLVIVSGGPPAPLGLVGLLVWEVLWVAIGVAALDRRVASPVAA
ncbi:hypothetical protein [Pseudonocardia xishanensis]|uniref:DUF308 domain-containing protein n=1 Tax=Pseudonocardia xishanensis TaxID=630995 RepID=A0ABP8RI88_9PSEU